MRKITALVAGLYLMLLMAVPILNAQVIVPPIVDDEESVQSEAFRSGRGGYRSPVGGYVPGNRAGVNPGYGTGRTDRNPGARDPARGTPAAPVSRGGGFLGGMMGGLFAGTLLGGLLNPFGFGGNASGMGGGFSILGLIFWAVVLYLVFRVVGRLFRGRR
jgi:hypothetical protein